MGLLWVWWATVYRSQRVTHDGSNWAHTQGPALWATFNLYYDWWITYFGCEFVTTTRLPSLIQESSDGQRINDLKPQKRFSRERVSVSVSDCCYNKWSQTQQLETKRMCCSSGSQRIEVSLRVSSCWQSCVPPGGPRGKYMSLPFPASGGSNAASITITPPLTLQFSFFPFKDSCDHTGPLSISQSLPNHIHTVPFLGKVTHFQLLAIRVWTSLGRVLLFCLLPGVEWQWKSTKDNTWSSIDLKGMGFLP